MTIEEAVEYLNTLYMALAVFPNQQISLGNVDEMKESVDMAIKALEREPKWIPISERLPEEGELVLTQAIFKDDVKLAVSSRVDYNYWTGWGTRDINIVAWMPLPQPYQEGKE